MESKVSSILEKNNDIRKKMLLRTKDNSFKSIIFSINKEEYQNTFEKNNELESIAEAMYLNSLSLNHYINSDRHLSDRYLTPELTSFYGANLKIDGNMGYFTPSYAHNGYYKNETGRLPNNYTGINVKIEDEYDSFDDIKNNGGISYLKEMFNISEKESNGLHSIYTPEEGKRYVEYDINEKDTISLKKVQKEIVDYEYDYSKDDDYSDAKINDCDLLGKTKKLFNENRIKNLESTKKPNIRLWNKSNQYSEVNDLMRPFNNGENGKATMSDVQRMNSIFRASLNENGEEVYLSNNTVLNNNGFVNITPVRKTDNSADVKKCMFSLENLAWKDVPHKEEYWSSEQRGPNGGRIMWFPPYDLSFSEDVKIDWSNNTFIGRGEPVYTYSNTTRSGTLKFSILIDHPNILNYVSQMGSQDNIDDDIYKFFAGEKLLDLVKTDKENTDDEVIDKGNDGEIVVENEESETISFEVFFPKNYSGFHNEIITEKEWMSYPHRYDEDWLLYMMIGEGTHIPENWEEYKGGGVTPDDWRGYEIRTDSMGLGEDKKSEDLVSYESCDKWELSSQYHIEGEVAEMTPEYLTDKEGKKITPKDAKINDVYYISDSNYVNYFYNDGDKWSPVPRYSYRTDFDMRPIATNEEDYINVKSYGKNINNDEMPAEDGKKDSYTFAEVFGALIWDNEYYKPVCHYLEGQMADIVIIKDYLTEKLKNKENITSIDITGYSSTEEGCGRKDNRELISKRRAYTVGGNLNYFLKIENDKFKYHIGDLGNESEVEKHKVTVEIKLKNSKIDNISDLASGTITSNNRGENILTDNIGVKFDSNTQDIENADKNQITTSDIVIAKGSRYENESTYFEKLHKDSPLVFERISEKFKYFNPAFHSISPEGFNARLTFLHQCTRQGHTIEASDNNYAQIAGNLAFGRMPVCVLRLGDFLNTRILIESMSITYDKEGMQWDLNPEGIGVQPMYATISLGITILGGQSLTGPISRLQNAVSFDYYANTGVYDDRADIVSISRDDTNGSYNETYDRLWSPYPENRRKNN